MELSQFTDYSLRTLLYVGVCEGKQCSVTEIAQAFSISRNHTVKVVQNLSRLGYLETRRGRGGGIQLKLGPEAIIVGEVVRKTEHFGLVECLPPRKGHCCIAGVCELQHALRQAAAAFLAELDKHTLADVIRNKQTLRDRLKVAPRPQIEPKKVARTVPVSGPENQS
jgi:Rrf2 family transcriptional regulator, nitric oxide-sensitive transcriptional repressor